MIPPDSALSSTEMTPAQFDPPDQMEEACGVFGLYAPGEDVATLTYFGLYALQHRGQESAGIATIAGGHPPLLQAYGSGLPGL